MGLRKGSHYLTGAARQLAPERNIEIVVAGPVPAGLLAHDVMQGPTYLGQVPRSEVMQEFRRADIFVLPTLSDGSALSHFEALAMGLPVITTPCWGSVVRDGVDGFIVEPDDHEALVGGIRELVGDRELR